jgi:hypothetical protein
MKKKQGVRHLFAKNIWFVFLDSLVPGSNRVSGKKHGSSGVHTQKTIMKLDYVSNHQSWV